MSGCGSETVNEKIVGPEGKCGCWENFMQVLGKGNGFSCRQVELVAPCDTQEESAAGSGSLMRANPYLTEQLLPLKPLGFAPRCRVGGKGRASGEVVQASCAAAVLLLGRGSSETSWSWGLSASEHMAGVRVSQIAALSAQGSISGFRFWIGAGEQGR